jgi:hypothetical protein
MERSNIENTENYDLREQEEVVFNNSEEFTQVHEVFGNEVANIMSDNPDLFSRVLQALKEGEWNFILMQDIHSVVGELFDDAVYSLIRHYGINPMNMNRVNGISEQEGSEYLTGRSLLNWLNQKNELIDGELEKSDREIELINRAIQEVCSTVLKYGGKPPVLTPNNIKIIEKESMDKVGDWESFRNFARIKRSKNELSEFNRIVHELFHAGSYTSIHFNIKENRAFSYRSGFTLINNNIKDKQNPAFRVFNEAMTEELTRRLVSNISEEDYLLGNLIKDKNITISNYEIKNGPDDVGYLKSDYLGGYKDDDGKYISNTRGYYKERMHLRNLIDEMVLKSAFEE